MRLPDTPHAQPAEPYDGRMAPDSGDPVDLETVLRFVKQRWKLCRNWTLAGICVALAFVLLSPRYYTAYTTMLLDDARSRVQAGVGNVAPDPATFVYSQMQVLQSDEVLGRVIDKEHLTQGAEFGRDGHGLVAKTIDYVRSLGSFIRSGGALGEKAARHETMIRIKRALSIRRLNLSNAVEIGFTSQRSLTAAKIVNAIAQSYIDGQYQSKIDARRDAALDLRRRLAQLREKAFPAEQSINNLSLTTPEERERARAKFKELQDDTATYRALYNTLQREYINSGSQIVSADARVISPAEPPLKHSWPPSLLLLAFGAAGGAAIGFGHSLLRHAAERSLITVRDLQRFSDLDFIATIPNVSDTDWKTDLPRRQALQLAYRKRSAKIDDVVSKLAIRLQVGRSQKKSVFVAVVAASPEAGASSIAAHLANTIAECSRTTLLVDANWRKREVSPNSETSSGLATSLNSIRLRSDKLDILLLRATSGLSELNASLSLLSVLQDWRSEQSFNYLVVDLHSVKQTADLEAILGTIDEVLVVTEAGKTSSEEFDRVIRLVPREKLSAVVVNKTVS